MKTIFSKVTLQKKTNWNTGSLYFLLFSRGNAPALSFGTDDQ